MQRATSDFLQLATSATWNERILQRVTRAFMQRAISATSSERSFQQATSDFTTSNEQRMNFNESKVTPP